MSASCLCDSSLLFLCLFSWWMNETQNGRERKRLHLQRIYATHSIIRIDYENWSFRFMLLFVGFTVCFSMHFPNDLNLLLNLYLNGIHSLNNSNRLEFVFRWQLMNWYNFASLTDSNHKMCTLITENGRTKRIQSSIAVFL